eukprot:15462929-Alexandrium_andersonii.AAC.1
MNGATGSRAGAGAGLLARLAGGRAVPASVAPRASAVCGVVRRRTRAATAMRGVHAARDVRSPRDMPEPSVT